MLLIRYQILSFMSMDSSSMSSAIIDSISGIDNATDAINKFYSSLCKYVEDNAQVYYTWSAALPPPLNTPDSTVLLECKIKTSGSLSPSGQDTPEGALGMLSSDLNKNASLWEIVWPSGFSISPAFILPTISLSPSNSDNQRSAWEHICDEIISGIKKATPGPLSGIHGDYTVPTPGAMFSSII